MERFTLAQAAEWTKGEAKGDVTLCAVSTDSRRIPEEALFLPLAGERFDGHDFIGKALENGAAAVMSHRECEEYPVPALYVENTSQALLDLAGGYRTMCGGVVVGVTGSVGKTTTKELLYAVLAQQFRAEKTEGNLNNEIGLPLTLMRMTKDTEVMVAEMGMNHFGELSRMTAAAQPDYAVITNIGTSHIEFLGSREGICKAKLEILEGLREGGTAVLCGDEPLLWDKRDSLGCKVCTYGVENEACDLVAQLREDGSFTLKNNGLESETLPIGESFTARLAIPGAHNVLNALAAASVMLLIGRQDIEEIVLGVEWSTILFFTGLFVIVGGMVKCGVITALGNALVSVTGGNVKLLMILILWGSAIFSSVLDNIPFVATMIPLILSMQADGMNVTSLWWALSLGACLGGNGTLIGASANVVLSGISAKHGHPITFGHYLKVGFPTMVLSVAISTVYLLVRFH